MEFERALEKMSKNVRGRFRRKWLFWDRKECESELEQTENVIGWCRWHCDKKVELWLEGEAGVVNDSESWNGSLESNGRIV